jgi:activating signal cointegrator complex subunit 3
MNCQVARLNTRCHIHINMLSLSVWQAHFSRAELPISDYITHLKSVLDQSIHIIHAMIDIFDNSGWLQNALTCMHLMQMII